MLEPDRGRVVEGSPSVADILHSQEVVESASAHIDDLQGQVDDLCEELAKAKACVTALEEALVRRERWANRIGIVVGDLLVEYHIKAEHQGKCSECNRTPCLSVLGALRTRPARAALGKEAHDG